MDIENAKAFRAAWNWHISQLAKLAVAANITYTHFHELETELQSWIDDALSLPKEHHCE